MDSLGWFLKSIRSVLRIRFYLPFTLRDFLHVSNPMGNGAYRHRWILFNHQSESILKSMERKTGFLGLDLLKVIDKKMTYPPNGGVIMIYNGRK